MFKTAETFGMYNSITVTLKSGPDSTFWFWTKPAFAPAAVASVGRKVEPFQFLGTQADKHILTTLPEMNLKLFYKVVDNPARPEN